MSPTVVSRTPAADFPGLSVLPRDINSVVEVQEEPFAAIEKAEAKKVVIDERREWAEDDVDEAEGAMLFGYCHLSPQR